MKNKRFVAFLLAVICILSLCSCDTINSFFDKDLESESRIDKDDALLVSHYIYVGQGDSEFIEFPDGKTMLIDAGPREGGDNVIKLIKKLGYKKIDFLIGTHPHSDHIGALADVIKTFDIGTIYMPDAQANTKGYEYLLQTIRNKNKKIRLAKAGMKITSSKEYDYSADILAPVGTDYESLNNYSVVIMVRYKNRRLLYTGDIEALAEKEIMDNNTELSADVVKAPHHGSSSSSTEEFIQRTGASYVIFSCGENNDYNHPHKKIVKRWEKAGAGIYRTDKMGTITVATNGDEISVKTEKQED